MKQLDNLSIIAVLGAVAVLAVLQAAVIPNSALVNLIVGGLLGYLAKAAQNPSS